MKNFVLPGKSGLDLELPDWSQMVDHSQRIDSRAAFLRIGEVYRLLPKHNRDWLQERWRKKCNVEFTL